MRRVSKVYETAVTTKQDVNKYRATRSRVIASPLVLQNPELCHRTFSFATCEGSFACLFVPLGRGGVG